MGWSLGVGVIGAADLLRNLADPRGGAVGKVRPSGAPAHRGLNALVGRDSCRDKVRKPRVSVRRSRLHFSLVLFLNSLSKDSDGFLKYIGRWLYDICLWLDR